MTDSDDSNTRSLLQYVVFALLLVIILSPFLLMLRNKVAHREQLWNIFCCKKCTESWARRVHYDEADLRTLRELEQPPQRERVGITGAYRIYQKKARTSRLLLHLTSWREDVKCGSSSDVRLQRKLAEIEAAQNQCLQSQQTAADATTSRASDNRAISMLTMPFGGGRIVGTNGRINESSSSSVAVSSNLSDFSNDSDDGSVYELVVPTPKNMSSTQSDRRSVVIVEEEEEEEEKKEDATSRNHEVV